MTTLMGSRCERAKDSSHHTYQDRVAFIEGLCIGILSGVLSLQPCRAIALRAPQAVLHVAMNANWTFVQETECYLLNQSRHLWALAFCTLT